MSRKSQAERDAVMKAIKNDLLRWTCERHAGDHPLDRSLLRDKAMELAGEHGLTDFKCSENWLTCFLKKHGFLQHYSGPIFNNYRVWIDAMRSVITQYRHKDLFHLDELTMYSDISPNTVSSTLELDGELDPSLKKTTVLMCCNASGTEKLPLLICSSYPVVIANESYVYSHSKDASINDTLFRQWLSHVSTRMSESNRKILLLLHRNRINAFRGLELSNVRHVFFPDAFPPLLRPLKRDVFHFVKMIYRSKYVEEIKKHGHRWNAENVVKSLVEAWQKVPRDLIIASFQRTSFRTDDCFLEIHCDAWENLKNGMSFKKFVTFDDELSTDMSYKQHKSTGTHEYNLRTRQIVTLVDNCFDDCTSDWREKEQVDSTRVNGDLREIYVRRNVNRKRSSLKRSYDKARLSDDYDEVNEVKPTNDSTSQNNKAVVSTPAKLPKIIDDVQIIETETQASKSDGTRLMQATVSSAVSRSNSDELDKTTVNDDESDKSNQVSTSNTRSIEFSLEVTNDVTSQQLDRGSPLATEETNVIVFYSTSEGKTEMSDLNENETIYPSTRKSLKRKRSNNAEESGNNSDDEPEQKRPNSNSNWADQYETTFAFGSSEGLAQVLPTVSVDAQSGVQLSRLRRSCDTERSIFTICPKKD